MHHVGVMGVQPIPLNVLCEINIKIYDIKKIILNNIKESIVTKMKTLEQNMSNVIDLCNKYSRLKVLILTSRNYTNDTVQFILRKAPYIYIEQVIMNKHESYIRFANGSIIKFRSFINGSRERFHAILRCDTLDNDYCDERFRCNIMYYYYSGNIEGDKEAIAEINKLLGD